eukprot:932140-Pyramimonas_sp.AAC.1
MGLGSILVVEVVGVLLALELNDVRGLRVASPGRASVAVGGRLSSFDILETLTRLCLEQLASEAAAPDPGAVGRVAGIEVGSGAAVETRARRPLAKRKRQIR